MPGTLARVCTVHRPATYADDHFSALLCLCTPDRSWYGIWKHPVWFFSVYKQLTVYTYCYTVQIKANLSHTVTKYHSDWFLKGKLVIRSDMIISDWSKSSDLIVCDHRSDLSGWPVRISDKNHAEDFRTPAPAAGAASKAQATGQGRVPRWNS